MGSQEQLESLDQVLNSDIEDRKKELAASFEDEEAIKNLPAQESTKETDTKVAKETPAKTTEPEKPAAEEPAKVLPDGKTDPQYAGLQRTISKKDQEIAELKSKLTEREQGEQRAAKFKEVEGQYHQMLTQRTLKTLKDLEAISEDDPKYDEKVALARARELADIRKWEREHPDVLGTTVEKPPAKLEPSQDGAKTEPNAVDEKEKSELVAFCESSLKTAGLDPDDPVFGFYAGRAPVKDESGQELDFERQVEWALGKTKDHYASVKTKFSVEAGVKRQTTNLPIGRGTVTGTALKAQDDFRPVTIDDALQEIRRERTL